MKISYVLLVLICLVNSQILPLHKHIANEIFKENKPYLIYVHGNTHNFNAEAIFNGYCFGDKLCAVLQPNIEQYYQLRQFIGAEQQQFFMLLDSNSKRKYLLFVTDTFTLNDLLTFEYDFINGNLQPFFASQQLPIQRNEQCLKLVGKNIGQFIRASQRVKVILLYTLNKHCQSCDQILAKFILYSQKRYTKDEVSFGYFNTFLNDHPIIADEKTPSLLIIIDQNYKSPFEMSAENLDILDNFLNQTLKRRVVEDLVEQN